MALLRSFLYRHRPSGVVTAFLVFFIVSYVIITFLDATDRDHVHKNADLRDLQDHGRRSRMDSIPANVMREFDQFHKEIAKLHYDYYDDVNNTNSRENENALNKHLEADGDLSRNNWNKFLDNNSKNKSKINDYKIQYGRELLPLRGNKTQMQPNGRPFVQVFNVMEESEKKRDSIKGNRCLLLKSHHVSSPICIHDPREDEIISGKLSTEGTWEGNYLYIVGSVLTNQPELKFLDLGCNIGVYTILAAKLGHDVVALDPNKVNLRLLTKSLNMGGISSRVTLLWNAVSNVRQNVTLYDIIGNIGGSFVDPADGTDDDGVDADHRTVAVTLDDLIPYFQRTPVFIKMDVETFELKALQGGERFFRSVDVRYVLMEWIYHRQYETGKDVIRFMAHHRMFPHVNAHHNTRLESQHYTSWPDNVLWIKYESHM